MTPSQRSHARIAPLALVVATLGGANWYLRPERALVWIIGLASMAFVWLVAARLLRTRAADSASNVAERRFVVTSAVTAGVMIAASLGVALASALGLAGEALPHRVVGVIMGAALLVLGNAVPKVIGPLAAGRCSPARTQSVQRFAGWAFAIGGLAYAAVWVFAPLEQAGNASVFIGAAAIVLVAARCAWAALRASPT